MVQKILNQSEIKPFKIKYYCEKRDPDFETKMHDVLVVYKQVEMQFDENGDIIVSTDSPMIHTIPAMKSREYRLLQQQVMTSVRRKETAVYIVTMNINALAHCL